MTDIAENFSIKKLRDMADTIDTKLEQSVAMPLVFAQNPLGLLIVFRSYQTTITADDLTTLAKFCRSSRNCRP